MARKQQPITTGEPAPAAPRFASLWAALAYSVAAMLLAYPALAGQFLGNTNSDQYKAGYAFREFAASYFKAHGSIPQWNPYLFGGMPFIGAMHGDIFYPTFLLRLILPVDIAMAWGMIFHFVLCGLATYWFLRHAARISFYAALVGGMAYMMGGFVSSLISAGHDGKLFVSALLPVTLLILTWGMRDGKKWAWGVLALIIGLAALSPHPQLLQYLLLTAGAWALFIAFSGLGDEALARDVAFKRLGLALAAVVVGMLIGAIQYLPVFEYQPWSPRATSPGWEFSTSFSFPLEELINTYLPQFSGILNNYWGRNNIHFHSEYVGASVLLLATAAFGAGWVGARKRFLRFWLGVAIVSLLWALGGSTPFFKIIYAIVPGTKVFRAPSTIFYVTTLAIAVMAALGTERLLTRKLPTRFAYVWLGGSTLIAFFALMGGFTAMASGLAQSPDSATRIAEGATDLKIGALRSLLFVGLTSGVILLLSMRRITARMAGVGLVAICAIDLWSVERLYWQFLPPAKELFATNLAVDFLRKLAQPARVISVELPEAPAGPGDPYIAGVDGLMSHRVRQSLIGYHGNELGRYRNLDDFDNGYRNAAFNPTFWAMTNTQFVLTNTDTLPISGARRVVGPVLDAAGTKLSLYLLPGEQPFAWVAPVMIKYPDDALRNALRAPNFPVHGVAVFDTSSKVAAQTLTQLPSPLAIIAKVTTYEPGHIALRLSDPAPKGSALVVSENFYPGWRATIDGKAAQAERADYLLIGVPLSEGARKVELTFQSDSYAKGKKITLVALLIALVAALGGWWLGRGDDDATGAGMPAKPVVPAPRSAHAHA